MYPIEVLSWDAHPSVTQSSEQQLAALRSREGRFYLRATQQVDRAFNSDAPAACDARRLTFIDDSDCAPVLCERQSRRFTVPQAIWWWCRNEINKASQRIAAQHDRQEEPATLK
ncbi:MAG: hypothetical protein MJE77_47420 [Proteobacteria bacterium]|nr:hypothetical protein [Pseudomonadota bacterium]